MPKAWLRDRWDVLVPLLEGLTLDQEEEIARICAEEIAVWKARPSMKSLSSLKEPMSDTRNRVKEIPLTDQNSYRNTRTGEREHIALKYLNYTEGEWTAMNAQSDQRFHERLENQQLLDHPDQIVAKADALLGSNNWTEVVIGLAVVTGRRLTEILKVGELHPKTLHTVLFSGQLKRKDEVLKPYEIPVLVDASRVLAAWSGLRKMIDCSHMETEAIGKAYGTELGEAAERHFFDLVPVRDGREKLFSHLFRAVYPRLAVFYFCPATVSDIAYVPTILGHYWANDGDEVQQRNYMSSLHYFDYKVGDGAGNIDGRQGIRLDEPGVEVLEVFRPKPVVAAGSKKKEQKVDLLGLEKKKEHSLTRIGQETKTRIDQAQQEEGCRTQDEALSTVLDNHYLLKQIIQLMQPLYEQLGTDNPVGAVRALLGEGGAIQVDLRLVERWQASLAEVEDLLEIASERAGEDVPYKNEYARAQAVVKGELSNGEKELTPLQSLLQDTLAENEEISAKAPVLYLRGLVNAKAVARKAYAKRHVGKDYSTIPTSKLRNTKMPGAAEERFKRAVNTIMRHNETVNIPEWRRYVSPALVNDLVGGRAAEIKTYIESRPDVVAHHEKYGLRPGINRIPLVSVKLEVPELPELPEGVKAELSEEGPSEEEKITEE